MRLSHWLLCCCNTVATRNATLLTNRKHCQGCYDTLAMLLSETWMTHDATKCGGLKKKSDRKSVEKNGKMNRNGRKMWEIIHKKHIWFIIFQIYPNSNVFLRKKTPTVLLFSFYKGGNRRKNWHWSKHARYDEEQFTNPFRHLNLVKEYEEFVKLHNSTSMTTARRNYLNLHNTLGTPSQGYFANTYETASKHWQDIANAIANFIAREMKALGNLLTSLIPDIPR